MLAMATKKQLGWRKLFLILTVLPCCSSLQVTIPETQYEVGRGGDIHLTCSFIPARPISETLIVRWEAYPDKITDPLKPVAIYYSQTSVDIAPAYEGRAVLEVDINKQDDEGTTAATTSLLVLVPPSAPLCRIQGTAEYWNDITLTCMSEEGSPKPTYEWKRFSVENRLTEFPPKTTEKDGALSLFNISREMSGFYICASTNQIGSSSCNLTLAVMPPSMNIGSSAAIIGGVIAGLLVLGIIIFCCCRKKNKKNKYAEGSPAEMEFNDKDGPETGEQYFDDKSKTEQHSQNEDRDIAPQNNYSIGTPEHVLEDDQHSFNSAKEKHDGKGSNIDSQPYDEHGRGSRDHLDDKCNNYSGSRDRLDDQRDRYGGSRDRLDDQRDRYGGSRDRLDDQRDRYGGSRDRLDDQRDRYGGSRDRLDDHRDRYGGSRDRLDDQRDRYGGSRDRLDDQRDRYGGSRDRLDDQRDRYRGSRDRLDYIDHP
uniref:cell surface A33 antigen isoform X2 n=1 Tax=Monopterus albus TaxID=43700 RepID=UPI0009B30256|nr:cell surface A33 antigen isoform X2 [Monopterus albus]